MATYANPRAQQRAARAIVRRRAVRRAQPADAHPLPRERQCQPCIFQQSPHLLPHLLLLSSWQGLARLRAVQRGEDHGRGLRSSLQQGHHEGRARWAGGVHLARPLQRTCGRGQLPYAVHQLLDGRISLVLVDRDLEVGNVRVAVLPVGVRLGAEQRLHHAHHVLGGRVACKVHAAKLPELRRAAFKEFFGVLGV